MMDDDDLALGGLDTLLKAYGYQPGTYRLPSGLCYRVWYEGEEMKTEEVKDDV